MSNTVTRIQPTVVALISTTTTGPPFPVTSISFVQGAIIPVITTSTIAVVQVFTLNKTFSSSTSLTLLSLQNEIGTLIYQAEAYVTSLTNTYFAQGSLVQDDGQIRVEAMGSIAATLGDVDSVSVDVQDATYTVDGKQTNLTVFTVTSTNMTSYDIGDVIPNQVLYPVGTSTSASETGPLTFLFTSRIAMSPYSKVQTYTVGSNGSSAIEIYNDGREILQGYVTILGNIRAAILLDTSQMTVASLTTFQTSESGTPTLYFQLRYAYGAMVTWTTLTASGTVSAINQNPGYSVTSQLNLINEETGDVEGTIQLTTISYTLDILNITFVKGGVCTFLQSTKWPSGQSVVGTLTTQGTIMFNQRDVLINDPVPASLGFVMWSTPSTTSELSSFAVVTNRSL